MVCKLVVLVIVLAAIAVLAQSREKFAAPKCECSEKMTKCLALGNSEDWCKRQGLYCNESCMWSGKFYPK